MPGVEPNQRTTLCHAKEPLRAKRLWMSSITPGISFTPDSASRRGMIFSGSQPLPIASSYSHVRMKSSATRRSCIWICMRCVCWSCARAIAATWRSLRSSLAKSTGEDLTSHEMEVEPSLTLRASAGRALTAPMTSRALPMYSFEPGWRTHTGRSQTPAALPAKAPPPRDDEGRSLTVRRVSS